MKKSLLVLFAVIICLTGCVNFSWARPESGIWYCEELDIYLDMSNSKGVYRADDGEYEPLFIRIDYGTGFYIYFCESQWSDEYLNCRRILANFKYKDGVLRLTDRESGSAYEFVEVAEEQYPGG